MRALSQQSSYGPTALNSRLNGKPDERYACLLTYLSAADGLPDDARQRRHNDLKSAFSQTFVDYAITVFRHRSSAWLESRSRSGHKCNRRQEDAFKRCSSSSPSLAYAFRARSCRNEPLVVVPVDSSPGPLTFPAHRSVCRQDVEACDP